MATKQLLIFLLLSGFVFAASEVAAQCQPTPPPGAGAAGGGGDPDPGPACETPDDDDSRDTPDVEEEESDLEWEVSIFNPSDPNDITGPPGYDTLRWVSVNETMPYLVRFENDPVFATAPAVRVEVICPIDDKHDILQFRLGSFGFNGMLFEVPPNTATYSTHLNLVEEMDILVDVIAGVNIVTREAFWIFQSIDPLTGLPVTDVDKGFLPVKDTTFTIENDTLGIGIPGDGFVNFTIKPSPTAQTRDTVVAYASIVFDSEGEILTNVEVHTIDALPPASSIQMLADTSMISNPQLLIDLDDDPQGCGVLSYDLYVSIDQAPYILFAQGQTGLSFIFNGEPGRHYRFITRARDNVFNLEEKTMPDAETTISPDACRQGAPCTVEGFFGLYNEYCDCEIDLNIACPGSIEVCPVDDPFVLTGGFPEGGMYGGTGVTDDWFDPYEAGTGIHEIIYTFMDPLEGIHICTFNISVRPGIVVNKDDNGVGSLREIIDCVPEGGTITFQVVLQGDTILLEEEIVIQKDLAINGLNAEGLVLSGGDLTRVFHLVPGKTLTLKSISLKDANGVAQGGALLIEGHLILEDVIFENNVEGADPKAFTVVPGATVEIRGVVEVR